MTGKRHSIRAKCYDYSWPGMYFVTICAHERRCSFGEIADGKVKLSRIGEIIRLEWLRTVQMRPDVELDVFVVMPNHFHAIIAFTKPALVGAHCVRPVLTTKKTNTEGARSAPLRTAKSLGSLIAGFKSAVTSQCKAANLIADGQLWQRNYFEHIIRDERGLEKIREYIEGNPCSWDSDAENPQRHGEDEFERWLRAHHFIPGNGRTQCAPTEKRA